MEATMNYIKHFYSMIPMVIYDIDTETIMFLKDGTVELSKDELRKNWVKMPYAVAKQIRDAKGLPMPCPPVEVEVGESLLSDPVQSEPDFTGSPHKRPKGFV